MIKIIKQKLLIRPEEIKPSSNKFEILGTLNPGAIRLNDNTIMLYVRVIEKLKFNEDDNYCYSPRMIGKKSFKIKIDRFHKRMIKESSPVDFVFHDGTKRLKFISHFRKIILDKSGFKVLEIDKKPSFFGIETDGELGVEDARITKIENFYAMTYVSLSRQQNIATSLAISKDTTNWERKGIIFGEQDKDVVIFPERVNGKYVAFDRPEGNFQFSPPHIWIAYSNDLTSWGSLKPIECVYEEKGLCPRNGAGPPPIKTEQGWLLIYHTVLTRDIIKEEIMKKYKKDKAFINKLNKMINEDNIQDEERKFFKAVPFYSVGAALFDLNDPEKMIAKSRSLLIMPLQKYDTGAFEDKKVVFPTGIVIDKDNNILIYSGGGDAVTTVKKVRLKDVLNSLEYKDVK